MEIRQLYKENPNTTSLDLKNRNFSDYHQIFKELESFKELIDVDLQGNNFEDIPENLSKLSRLRSLDITNNPFVNVNYLIYCCFIRLNPLSTYPFIHLYSNLYLYPLNSSKKLAQIL